MKERVGAIGRGRILQRALAFVLALALCITGLPIYSADTVEASSGATWESWEDLYDVMAEKKEEYGFSGRGLSDFRISVRNYEDFWDNLVAVMDALDITDADTDYEKVYAIANWIGENVYYSTEGDHGCAAYILENGHGACEGYACLFYIMCAYVGVDATVIACGETNHAWNAVKVDGSWYWADLTAITASAASKGNFLNGKDSWFTIEYDATTIKVLATSMAEWAEENISEYSYLYYNSSCNGVHDFVVDGYLYAGTNYGCDNGFISYVCTDCRCYHAVELKSEIEHEYVEYIVEPTCINEGYSYKKCSVCGEYEMQGTYIYKYNITEALGHLESDTDDLNITKEPTCTTTGTGYTYCKRDGCDKTQITKVTIPATGHDWDEGEITTAATATTAGVKTYTCQTCGGTKTESIAATGGSLNDATIVLEYDTCTYDATSHFPEVTVYIDGVEVENTVSSTTTNNTTKVVTGTMYTVTYRTSAAYKAAGQVPVVISAGTNGLLTDEVTVYFTIEKADTTVTASIDSDTILAGETAQITASAAVDTTGTSRTVHYESSDTSVATVSSSGVVTGVSAGVAVITVYTAANTSYYNQGYAYITVTVTDENSIDMSGASVSLGSSSYTYDGTAKEPSVTVTLDGTTLTLGTDYMVSYADNTDAGTATVTIAGCGSYSGSVVKTFTISAASVSDAEVTLGSESYTYDGTAKTPSVTVTLNGTTLTQGTDYTVSYSDNTAAGTATVTVTGCGNYTGTVSGAYTINAADISGAVVTLSSNEYTYDGNAKEPAVTVVYNGTTLTEGTDYTVSYSNNTNAGTASVAITGAGNYTGTYTGKFLISKADAAVIAGDVSVDCGGTAEITASSTSGGTLSYKSSDTSVATVSEDGVVTGVSSGTATITVTSAATDNHNAAEVEITVTVDAVDISDADIVLDSSFCIYDGTAKTPEAEVTLNGTALVLGKDYIISCSNNVNAGTATATIAGIGSYTGSITVYYAISKGTQSVTITGETEYAKGEALSLTATALGGADITWDYGGVVSALANGTAGEYTVTATAAETDNYFEGSASVVITVKDEDPEPESLANATVTLGSTSYTYDGTAKKPSVTVTLDGVTLTEGTDYTVSYASNTNAGTAAVVVTGCGDYTGTAGATFTINKATQSISLSSSSVSIAVGGSSTVTASASGNGTITWSSNSTSVATVSGGTITGKAVGTTTVTVSAAETDNYNAATATISVSVKPAAPTLSSVENTTSGVKVTWTKVTGATGYYVYRKTGSGSYSKVGEVTSGSTLNWTDTSVTSGTNYTYKVYAYASTGTGAASSTKTIRYLTAGKISSASNLTSGIKLTWSKVTGASGYYVYRKTGSGSYSKIKTITSNSTVTYTDTAVKNNSGTTYTYAVRPYYTSGSTTYTGSYSGKGIMRLTSASVSSLTNTSSGITVKWGKVTGANGYYIYRKTSGGSYSCIKTITSGSTVSYTDTAVKSKNGTTYVYYVIPYFKNSSGVVTKGANANTKTIARVTGVSLSSVTNSSSKKMTVKWAKNSKATGYQIQYSTSSSFSSGNKTVTVTGASSVSKVISSLTKGKTYYVRIRAYKTVSGTKYYSAWNSKKSVKISK